MVKKDTKLIERGLTLFSTGKFSSRKEALQEAINEHIRAEEKKKAPPAEEIKNDSSATYF